MRHRSKLMAVIKQGRLQFEEQMAQERLEKAQRRPRGWDKHTDAQ